MSNITNTAGFVAADLTVRVAARVIDGLVLGAIGAVLGREIGYGFGWLLVTAAVVLLYFAVFDAYMGATPGKLAVGLRVVGPAGGAPKLGQAFAREAFTALGAIPGAGPVLALGAWAWIAITIKDSPLRQGKHDMLAGGTRVIRRQTFPNQSASSQGRGECCDL